MKVFISWSGEKSKAVATILKEFISSTIQAVNPWLSTQDIGAGSQWFREINNQLSDTSIGILCLTQENKEKPWILFEAGALAKGLDSNRVVPLLIDLKPNDITGPLLQFNAVVPEYEGMKKLLGMINTSLGNAELDGLRLAKYFEVFYPIYHQALLEIINDPSYGKEEVIIRPTEDLMQEVLTLVRQLDKRVSSQEQGTSPYYGANYPSKSQSFRTAFHVIKGINSLTQSNLTTILTDIMVNKIFKIEPLVGGKIIVTFAEKLRDEDIKQFKSLVTENGWLIENELSFIMLN